MWSWCSWQYQESNNRVITGLAVRRQRKRWDKYRKLEWNIIEAEGGGEGKGCLGTSASICLWRRRCQLPLGFREWLPADMDLISQCTAAKEWDIPTADRIYKQTHVQTSHTQNNGTFHSAVKWIENHIYRFVDFRFHNNRRELLCAWAWISTFLQLKCEFLCSGHGPRMHWFPFGCDPDLD